MEWRARARPRHGVQWLLAVAIAASFVAAYAAIDPPIVEGASCEQSKCIWTGWMDDTTYCCPFLGYDWVRQWREERRICLLRIDPDGTCVYEYCGHCAGVEFRCTAKLCT